VENGEIVDNHDCTLFSRFEKLAMIATSSFGGKIMRHQSILLGLTLVLAGCASPNQFIQQTSQSLSNIANAITDFDTFKTQIATNASYARLAYADTMKSTSLINRRLPKQIVGDVCLGYAISKDIQDADIQTRVKKLKALLASANNILCSGSPVSPANSTSAAAASDATKSTDGSAPSCPTTKAQTAQTSFMTFLNLFSDVAGLTPADAYTTAASSLVQAGINLYNLAEQQRNYLLTVAFLQESTTQNDFKYAVTRLESDLKDADNDLESNMHTWKKCETARLSIAQSTLAWNDGSSILAFSREAVESKKTFDEVRKQYLAYKKSFISDQTSSLNLLETAFAKLPTLSTDPASLDAVVKALGTIQTNVQKLEATSTSTAPTKSKTAAAYAHIQFAMFGRPTSRQQTADRIKPADGSEEAMRSNPTSGESAPKSSDATYSSNSTPLVPRAENIATPRVGVD
jgi:hypothetical protein